MKGKYKKPDGEIVNVVDFDAANRMAYVQVSVGHFKWYPKSEYETWVSESAVEPIPEVMKEPDAVMEEIALKPKKKVTKKSGK